MNRGLSRRTHSKPKAQGFNPSILMLGLTLLTSGALLAIALLAVVGISRTGAQFWQGLSALFQTQPPEPKVDVRSIIVQQVRPASELTTAIFTMEAVVPTQQDRTLGGLTVGSTKLLYIAYGEVRAGIDLAQITPLDIQINGEQATLRLPAPKILDAKIDVNRSRVYDYDRGILGFGPDAAIELQSLASQTALNRIVEAACSQNILNQANQRAQAVLNQLLGQSLGQSLRSAGIRSMTIAPQSPSQCLPPPNPAPSDNIPAPPLQTTPIPLPEGPAPQG